MDYPPFTKQEKSKIYRRAALYLVALFAVKFALYTGIALVAGAFRKANNT